MYTFYLTKTYYKNYANIQLTDFAFNLFLATLS